MGLKNQPKTRGPTLYHGSIIGLGEIHHDLTVLPSPGNHRFCHREIIPFDVSSEPVERKQKKAEDTAVRIWMVI